MPRKEAEARQAHLQHAPSLSHGATALPLFNHLKPTGYVMHQQV